MTIKELRMQRGWSQEQLSELTGLSVRTIQRIEKGSPAGLESTKALAAVFELPLAELKQMLGNESQVESFEPETNTDADVSTFEEKHGVLHKKRKGLQRCIGEYLIIVLFLLAINLFTNPDYLWVIWPALGLTLDVLLRANRLYSVTDLFVKTR